MTWKSFPYGILILMGMYLSCNPDADLSGGFPTGLRNVVVILADDHAQKIAGCYGNPIVNTPNIDRLAREGIAFTRAYCNAPICSASRASLLTGKYPHATGVNLLFTPFPDQGNTTIAEHLKDQGYKTGLFGKTHFNNWVWGPLYRDGLPNHGFDTLVVRSDFQNWLQSKNMPNIPESVNSYSEDQANAGPAQKMNSANLPHPHYDDFSQGAFFANQAVEFIRKNRDNPFLAWVAFYEPHQPFYFPIEYAGKYHPSDFEVPTANTEDRQWIPEKYLHFSEKQKQGITAAYYSSTEYMDKNIGIVLDALEELGLEENTIVIYISDNGYLLGEHGRFEKHSMWEESVRQPLILRVGKSFQPGTRQPSLVEYIDIVPTILDLLQAKPLPEVQGKSFLELLSGKTADHKGHAFASYLEDNMAMVCTKKWKYIFSTGRRDLGIGYATGKGPAGIRHQLYFLPDDPGESTNLAQNKLYKPTLDSLQQVMVNVFKDTHPESNACPEELTVEGKLVWYCEPRDIGSDQSLQDVPWRVFQPQNSENEEDP